MEAIEAIPEIRLIKVVQLLLLKFVDEVLQFWSLGVGWFCLIMQSPQNKPSSIGTKKAQKLQYRRLLDDDIWFSGSRMLMCFQQGFKSIQSMKFVPGFLAKNFGDKGGVPEDRMGVFQRQGITGLQYEGGLKCLLEG
ncbi:unnamed protein product [Citrullus colocynthis]|uniref:Uncharacterized protein n=1 Tax=Citrullus colocynthis TaxID=252529 RepID=A0ABP0Y8T2_9ROSI